MLEHSGMKKSLTVLPGVVSRLNKHCLGQSKYLTKSTKSRPLVKKIMRIIIKHILEDQLFIGINIPVVNVKKKLELGLARGLRRGF